MRRRSVKLAAACMTVSAVALATACIETAARARDALSRVLADHAGLSVAGLSVNPLLGRVTLRGIATQAGGWRIRIGAVTLPFDRAGLVSPAFAASPESVTSSGQTGTATADDIVIADGSTTYRMKHIELDGTPLSNSDLAALLDPKSGDPIEARLRKLTAATVAIPDLAADSVNGAAENHWTQTHILLAKVTGGRASEASTGPASLAVSNGKKASNFVIGAMQATGVDLGQIARVFVEARTDDSEKLLPLYDTLSVTAIKLTDVTGGQGFTIASVKERDARGRALKGGLRATSMALAQAKPTDPDARAFLDDLLQSVAVGSVNVADVASAPGGKTPEQDLRIADIVADKIGGGRTIGALKLRDLHFTDEQGKITLASVAFGDISLPPPSSDATPKTGIARPSIGRFDFTGLDVDLNTAGRGQPEKRIAFAIDRMSAAASDTAVGRIPPEGTMSIDHIRFDVPASGDNALLSQLGYKRLDISSRLVSAYDASRQTFSIDRFEVGEPGMGVVNLKLGLANVSENIASSNPAIQKASALAMLFKNADLVVSDAGLVDRALRHRAEQDGKTIEDERAAYIDFVQTQLPAQLGNPPKLKPLTAALAQFIAQPKTLHVAISSDTGLGVADAGLLGDPLALIDRLDIRADANQ